MTGKTSSTDLVNVNFFNSLFCGNDKLRLFPRLQLQKILYHPKIIFSAALSSLNVWKFYFFKKKKNFSI